MLPPLSRRRFLANSSLVLASAAIHGLFRSPRLLAAEALAPAAKATPSPALRFAIVTDLHYADKNPGGTRVYRDSLAKLQTAVQSFNDLAKSDKTGLSFGVALGDLVDSAGPTVTDQNIATELGYLKIINGEWAKLAADRHYVLGNHCVDTLTKAEFYDTTKAKPAPYSFDAPFKQGAGEVHCVFLDACFITSGAPYGRKNFDWKDTNLPDAQLTWLEQDLAKTKNPAIIFVHQRLEGQPDYCVHQSEKVRTLLEKSGKVLAVFQGHSHQNSFNVINGIPYCVIRAIVEGPGATNNSFAALEVFPDYSIGLHGSFQQTSYANLRDKLPPLTIEKTATPPAAPAKAA